jgi:subtilase family serine protease
LTSDDAASGGNVVNQVERLFNGLGQITTEYQSHSGTVNQVQRAFTGRGQLAAEWREHGENAAEL